MKIRLLSITLIVLLLAGCTAPSDSTPAVTTTAPVTTTAVPWVQQEIGRFEAEDGVMEGNTFVENNGYVTGFTDDGDRCTVTVTVPEDGFYDLEFMIKPLGGDKTNTVIVDGAAVGDVTNTGNKFQRVTLGRIYLSAGEHAVGIQKNWGYINWDCVIVYTSEPFDERIFHITEGLTNKNATDEAKRLYSYLLDCYGKVTISGQYCDSGMNGWENLLIYQNSGKYPAILGLDMGYYSQTGVDHKVEISTTEQAITYWDKGGIVTICWHWLAPEKYINGTWYSAFRPEHTNINVTKILNGQDEEGYSLLMKDIDNIAQQLLKLQDAGVPILWRPLHEASGGWFWWGAEGAQTYKQLYILLYETLTNEYGLNNLIWVWNGQDADWYPGDEYVDIVGIDIYAGEHAYASQINAFLENVGYSAGKKLVVLSENGTMIDPELSARDRAMFGFFCTWSGEFVMKDGLRKAYSEQYTDLQMLKKVYNSSYVITRDELPDLKTYPIRDDLQ